MKTHEKGFTLIELILVIVILGIIAGVSANVMSSSFKSSFDNQNITNADEQGRLSIERMIRDIHAIGSSGSIITATSTQFSFINTSGQTITYALSGTNLQRNGINLADGISAISFGYYASNGTVTTTLANIRYINITLTVTQNNVNYKIATTVSTLNYIY